MNNLNNQEEILSFGIFCDYQKELTIRKGETSFASYIFYCSRLACVLEISILKRSKLRYRKKVKTISCKIKTGINLSLDQGSMAFTFNS